MIKSQTPSVNKNTNSISNKSRSANLSFKSVTFSLLLQNNNFLKKKLKNETTSFHTHRNTFPAFGGMRKEKGRSKKILSANGEIPKRYNYSSGKQ